MAINTQVLVGLGNPHSEHVDTRHNVGVWWLQKVADNLNITLEADSRYNALVGYGKFEDTPLCLVFPQTFMNRSGQAVSALLDQNQWMPNQLIVAHDELEVLPGHVQLKNSGGHAGHNGLRHIIETLGSAEFKRIRFGIGRPSHGSVHDHVLSAPSATDRHAIKHCIDNVNAKFSLLLNDWEATRQFFQSH